MAGMPNCLWFPSGQHFVVARPATTALLHASVYAEGPDGGPGSESFLGEIFPSARPGGHVTFRTPGPLLTPFTLSLRQPRAVVAAQICFLPIRIVVGAADPARLRGDLGPWEHAQAHIVAWEGPRLRCLATLDLRERHFVLEPAPDWLAAGADILLTPGDAAGRQGPTEVVSLARPENGATGQARSAGWLSRMMRPATASPTEAVPAWGPDERLLAVLRSAGLAGTGPAPTILNACLEGIRHWPAPVLAALTDALAEISDGDRRFHLETVCARLGRPNDLVSFFRAYEARPELFHLLASRRRLLAAARLLSAALPQPCTAAGLVAALIGSSDLAPLLEQAGAEEVLVWADAACRREVSPALRWLRLEKRCPVTPREAETAARLLDALAADRPTDLQAELLPTSSSPLPGALTELSAAAARVLEVPLSREALVAAQQASSELRRLLTEHLEQLLRRPEASRPPVGPALELLGQGASLSAVAACLARIQPGPAGAVSAAPGVGPPVWLRADRAFLTSQRERAHRVAGWCQGLLEARQFGPLALAPILTPEAVGALVERWRRWRQEWDEIDFDALFTAVSFDLAASVYVRLRQEAAHAESQAPALRKLIRPMTGDEARRWTAWLEQEQLRRCARDELQRFESVLTCPEARASAAKIVRLAQAVLEKPVNRWGPLLGHLTALTVLETTELESREVWCELLEQVPPALNGPLGRAPDLSVLDHGLGPALLPAPQRIDAVARPVIEKMGTDRAFLEALDLMAVDLGLAVIERTEATVTAPRSLPGFQREAFQKLAALLPAFHTAEALTSSVEKRLREVTAELARRVTMALIAPHGAGVEAPAVNDQDRRQLTGALEALVRAGDVRAVHEAAGRLERVAALLRERADVLGLGREPVGIDLVRLPLAERLAPQSGGAALVRLLRRLGEAPCVPAELLTAPGRVEALADELDRVTGASSRRWWARLYRDLGDSVRGWLAGLPAVGPPWAPPKVSRLCDLRSLPAWVRWVERELATGGSAPPEVVAALVAVGMAPGSNGRADDGGSEAPALGRYAGGEDHIAGRRAAGLPQPIAGLRDGGRGPRPIEEVSGPPG